MKKTTDLPKPVKTDSRNAFALEFYTSAKDADAVVEHVKDRGEVYWGGFFHGMPCGREPSHDHFDATHGKLFAVSRGRIA